ncbi:hypothetical protein [Brasilonema sp. UFV-L1]|uniref:hypothetical protein n=1 Tax=Brasilonema sp. UFV-L1 TaxID=2234130 RepID=UPI00145EFA43|nr:hypothetical protein [Brasilonema sp. UFV-L1]
MGILYSGTILAFLRLALDDISTTFYPIDFADSSLYSTGVVTIRIIRHHFLDRTLQAIRVKIF